MRKRQSKKKSRKETPLKSEPPDVIAGAEITEHSKSLKRTEEYLGLMRMACLTGNFNQSKAEMLAYQIRKIGLEINSAEWAKWQSRKNILKKREELEKEIDLLQKAGEDLFIKKMIGEKYAQIKGLSYSLSW